MSANTEVLEYAATTVTVSPSRTVSTQALVNDSDDYVRVKYTIVRVHHDIGDKNIH